MIAVVGMVVELKAYESPVNLSGCETTLDCRLRPEILLLSIEVYRIDELALGGKFVE